ncbi:MAG TPA: hypothetical protein VFV93_09500 [Thermomicrobiales bacterium]|nr:hypothetical protein [Thermomicrobiales bacterium]
MVTTVRPIALSSEPTPARPVLGEPANAPAAALDDFLRAQAVNVSQHAAALRPFRADEFGSGPEAPSSAHIQAANDLIDRMRQSLLALSQLVQRSAQMSAAAPDSRSFNDLLTQKDRAGDRVKSVERVWDFYLELFGQRQSRYAGWLLGADRIAIDCYQAVYTGLGRAQPVPSPLPFAFMATGFTPATFRRGVPLTKLVQQNNPFPIVEIPFHRLVNPWTLGAIHHEVSHNLQNDLGLWTEVPRRIGRRLRQAGIDSKVAMTWSTWNKEIWADLCGLLLGGPAVVASLIDVVAVAPSRALSFNPTGVHPTPYLRTLINLELLNRMGFTDEAAAYRALWDRLYPDPRGGHLPAAIMDSFDEAHRIVVDEICYTPYARLGNKRLAEVVSFNTTHDAMTREAGERLARGADPGVVPVRFLVGAARWALDRRLATPYALTKSFYDALVRR